MGIFKKFNFGLKKSRDKLSGAIDDMLDSFDTFEDDLYTELEEILVMGDVGVTTAVQIAEELRKRVASQKIKDPSEAREEIKEIVAEMLNGGEDMGLITVPSVILVIGVNGVGKTTTIGKMAAMYRAQGKSVILAAADTFRAAAIDQLDIWAKRAGVDIIKHKEGADPAAVIFDTISAAKARNTDIIICDTAGRLHNKKYLMDELAKIYRVIDRELPYSDREVLLVLDATTGQNAVNQAREFMNVAELTGIVLTKLDGTARGGVVLSIKNELKIPVKFVGVGEQIDDLQPFNPRAFAEGLFNAQVVLEDDDDEGFTFESQVESEDSLDSDDSVQYGADHQTDLEEYADNDEARAESEDEPAYLLDQETSADDDRADKAGIPEREQEPEDSEILTTEPEPEVTPLTEPEAKSKAQPEEEDTEEENIPAEEPEEKASEPEKKHRFGFFGRKKN